MERHGQGSEASRRAGEHHAQGRAGLGSQGREGEGSPPDPQGTDIQGREEDVGNVPKLCDS